MKPGGILHDSTLGNVASKIVPMSVKVDVLAKCMVDLAINVCNGEILLNKEIVERGCNLQER